MLATRPLLFSLLKTRLDHPEAVRALTTSSGSTRTLLQMCIDSAQHIVAVLERLKEQNLLESFLPFDMEAAFVAGMVLLLAPVVDQAFLGSHSLWLHMAYAILDELISQGHLQASARKTELQQLQHVFSQMTGSTTTTRGRHGDSHGLQPGSAQQNELSIDPSTAIDLSDTMAPGNNQFDLGFIDDAFWRTGGYTADHLMNVADTLDLDGIEWMTTGSSNLAE